MSDTVPLADSRGKIRKLAKNNHVIVPPWSLLHILAVKWVPWLETMAHEIASCSVHRFLP